MEQIAVNTQRNPAGYLARRFVINYNLKAAIKATDGALGSGNVPAMTSMTALALASFALLRLRTAQLAATDDGAGTWDAELAAAQTFADKALAAVSATQPSHFPTAQRIFAKLQTYGNDFNSGTIPAPADLPVNWATTPGAQPVASAQTISQAKHLAVDIDLLAGVTNAESSETLSVLTVDGENWELGRQIVIGGVTFTMAASYHLTASAPNHAMLTTVVPVVITDGKSAPISRNLSISLTNTAPTASAFTENVAQNVAISRNFLTLSSAADANSDTVRITEINGVDVPTPFAAGTYQFVVGGVTFTLNKATGVVTAPAQSGTPTFSGTFKVGDDDANDRKETAALNWELVVVIT